MNDIPAWRRVFFCLRRFRLWRLARHYNAVAADAWRAGDLDLYESVRCRAVKVWAKVLEGA